MNRILCGLSVAWVALGSYAQTLDVKQPQAVMSKTMQLQTPSITATQQLNMDMVAHGNGCVGQDLSPALQWRNIPKNAKSLVITMYDPDAPTGSGFWHWVAYNVPTNLDGLQQGVSRHLTNSALELKNDAGTQGYHGACPPIGDQSHRYIITLYALNTVLDVPNSVSPAVLGFNLNGKVIEKTQIIGFYGR